MFLQSRSIQSTRLSPKRNPRRNRFHEVRCQAAKLRAKSRQGKSGEIPNETLQLLIEASHDHQDRQ